MSVMNAELDTKTLLTAKQHRNIYKITICITFENKTLLEAELLMKKYKRRVPIESPSKIAICLIVLLIAILIMYFLDKESIWMIVFVDCFISFFGLLCGIILQATHSYTYDNSMILLFYSIIKYREIKYTDFSYVCISNASFSNRFIDSPINNSMKYKSKGTKKQQKQYTRL